MCSVSSLACEFLFAKQLEEARQGREGGGRVSSKKVANRWMAQRRQRHRQRREKRELQLHFLLSKKSQRNRGQEDALLPVRLVPLVASVGGGNM